MAAYPLAWRGVSGGVATLQQYNLAEAQQLAHVVLSGMAANVGTYRDQNNYIEGKVYNQLVFLESNSGLTMNSIGEHIDTWRREDGGIASETVYIRRSTTSPGNISNTLLYATVGSTSSPLKTANIYDLIDFGNVAADIVAADGPFAYRISQVNPNTESYAGVWEQRFTLNDYYNDKLEGETYYVWQRTDDGGYSTFVSENRIVKLEGAEGYNTASTFAGVIKLFTDEEINKLSTAVYFAMGTTGIGQYVFQETAPGTGTWVACGSVTDKVSPYMMTYISPAEGYVNTLISYADQSFLIEDYSGFSNEYVFPTYSIEDAAFIGEFVGATFDAAYASDLTFNTEIYSSLGFETSYFPTFGTGLSYVTGPVYTPGTDTAYLGTIAVNYANSAGIVYQGAANYTSVAYVGPSGTFSAPNYVGTFAGFVNTFTNSFDGAAYLSAPEYVRNTTTFAEYGSDLIYTTDYVGPAFSGTFNASVNYTSDFSGSYQSDVDQGVTVFGGSFAGPSGFFKVYLGPAFSSIYTSIAAYPGPSFTGTYSTDYITGVSYLTLVEEAFNGYTQVEINEFTVSYTSDDTGTVYQGEPTYEATYISNITFAMNYAQDTYIGEVLFGGLYANGDIGEFAGYQGADTFAGTGQYLIDFNIGDFGGYLSQFTSPTDYNIEVSFADTTYVGDASEYIATFDGYDASTYLNEPTYLGPPTTSYIGAGGTFVKDNYTLTTSFGGYVSEVDFSSEYSDVGYALSSDTYSIGIFGILYVGESNIGTTYTTNEYIGTLAFAPSYQPDGYTAAFTGPATYAGFTTFGGTLSNYSVEYTADLTYVGALEYTLNEYQTAEIYTGADFIGGMIGYGDYSLAIASYGEEYLTNEVVLTFTGEGYLAGGDYTTLVLNAGAAYLQSTSNYYVSDAIVAFSTEEFSSSYADPNYVEYIGTYRGFDFIDGLASFASDYISEYGTEFTSSEYQSVVYTTNFPYTIVFASSYMPTYDLDYLGFIAASYDGVSSFSGPAYTSDYFDYLSFSGTSFREYGQTNSYAGPGGTYIMSYIIENPDVIAASYIGPDSLEFTTFGSVYTGDIYLNSYVQSLQDFTIDTISYDDYIKEYQSTTGSPEYTFEGYLTTITYRDNNENDYLLDVSFGAGVFSAAYTPTYNSSFDGTTFHIYTASFANSFDGGSFAKQGTEVIYVSDSSYITDVAGDYVTVQGYAPTDIIETEYSLTYVGPVQSYSSISGGYTGETFNLNYSSPSIQTYDGTLGSFLAGYTGPIAYGQSYLSNEEVFTTDYVLGTSSYLGPVGSFQAIYSVEYFSPIEIAYVLSTTYTGGLQVYESDLGNYDGQPFDYIGDTLQYSGELIGYIAGTTNATISYLDPTDTVAYDTTVYYTDPNESISYQGQIIVTTQGYGTGSFLASYTNEDGGSFLAEAPVYYIEETYLPAVFLAYLSDKAFFAAAGTEFSASFGAGYTSSYGEEYLGAGDIVGYGDYTVPEYFGELSYAMSYVSGSSYSSGGEDYVQQVYTINEFGGFTPSYDQDYVLGNEYQGATYYIGGGNLQNFTGTFAGFGSVLYLGPGQYQVSYKSGEVLYTASFVGDTPLAYSATDETLTDGVAFFQPLAEEQYTAYLGSFGGITLSYEGQSYILNYGSRELEFTGTTRDYRSLATDYIGDNTYTLETDYNGDTGIYTGGIDYTRTDIVGTEIYSSPTSYIGTNNTFTNSFLGNEFYVSEYVNAATDQRSFLASTYFSAGIFTNQNEIFAPNEFLAEVEFTPSYLGPVAFTNQITYNINDSGSYILGELSYTGEDSFISEPYSTGDQDYTVLNGDTYTSTTPDYLGNQIFGPSTFAGYLADTTYQGPTYASTYTGDIVVDAFTDTYVGTVTYMQEPLIYTTKTLWRRVA